MRLPLQAPGIDRASARPPSARASPGGHVGPSRRYMVTGMAVCRKGANVLWTADDTVCVANTHAGCTAAKNQAVTTHAAQCTQAGGAITQSTHPCGVGDPC
ncbi:hypothetical protein [Tautonia plasticadhaerens]|uniref:Uncharacterized protein n=1 Tax=Tautonia plasticadhaerens TaxID=2527974 RepID=A0A518HDQ5_9BACT|nr:hypothetical protein [Tautonia plasticadhaerens]QDV38985.1 hypothetical protein ElP_69460 [Tautonia plasticadhaerens]